VGNYDRGHYFEGVEKRTADERSSEGPKRGQKTEIGIYLKKGNWGDRRQGGKLVASGGGAGSTKNIKQNENTPKSKKSKKSKEQTVPQKSSSSCNGIKRNRVGKERFKNVRQNVRMKEDHRRTK